MTTKCCDHAAGYKTAGRVIGKAAGFTLIELIIFIVIISVGIAGILSVLNLTAQHSADPMIHKQSLSIAEALMEEVSLAKFTYCDPADPNAETASAGGCTTVPENVGPEPGNTRPFDNVNDYVTAYGVQQPIGITDVNGANIAGLSGYSATIQITQELFGGIAANDSLHIVIRVTHGNDTLRLDGFRTRYAPNLMP